MTPDHTYVDQITRWRERMDEGLRAEEGWLSLAGLFWLDQGEHTVGADPACAVALPAGSAPARVATLAREGDTVTLRPVAGAGLTVNGQPAAAGALRSDAAGQPDLLRAGRVSFSLIRRGERLGVRVRDPESPARREFAGRRWFPIRPEYRVTARFLPHEPARVLPILNMLGDTEQRQSPGRLSFSLGGHELSLETIASGEQLFIIFRDATAGAETYGAGRFLYTALPRDGLVELDFNRAYNPPCAFSPYTTCPMPPRENILPLRIEAGELH